MSLPLTIFFPIAAGIYGGFVGGYIHKKEKSRKREIILGISGAVLVLLFILALLHDLSK